MTLTAGDLTTLSLTARQRDATTAGNAAVAATPVRPGTSQLCASTRMPPAAPTLALGTGVANGATAAEATAPSGVVTVTGEAGDSISVTFTNGVHTVTKTVTGTGSAQAVVLSAGDLTTLTDGTISVSATQTDAAGNAQTVAAATTSFVLDTSAPAETLAITSIAGSSSPTDTSITVSGSNGALAAGDKIQISADGVNWTDVVQNTATAWSFADTVTRTANFTYRVRVVDTAGNPSALATQDILVANGGIVPVGASSAFVAEFTGTAGGTLQFTPSAGITGTVNAISIASGPIVINGSGSVTSGVGDAIDLTATGGTLANPANLSISPTGPITGAAGGISVVQNATGAISITTSGPVIGQAGRGIFAEQSATGIGSILINGSGNVTGIGGDNSGIFAENLDVANNSDITISQTGSISGGRDGIRALTNGNGNVTVTTGASAHITGSSLYGIEATSNGTGSIAVTTASGDLITSGSVGINAYNQSTSIPQNAGVTTSSISVNAFGVINSGSALTGSGVRPAGILAGYRGGTTNTANPSVFGNVTVNNSANITAAGGDGIRAYNYGSGNVSVIDNSNTTIVANDVFGIAANSYGSGKILVTTAAGDSITSGASGINAMNLATATVGAGSSVSVTAHGTIHSGVHLTQSGSQPQGISAGYYPGNAGVSNTNVNGTVFVDNFANVTADAGWGINAFNWGNGSVTLIDEASTVVSGAQFGIAASSLSSGAGSSGSVTINVGQNARITAGALYGIAGIQGNESNAGNISITTSTGDIITSGGFGIQANNSSTATATSQISITTVGGSISSGFDSNGGLPAGISAGYNPGNQGVVNSNVQGNVIIDDAANITAASGFGINLYNFSAGSLQATIEAGTTISAPATGVNAFAQGGGNVTIANNGTITVAAGSGIAAGTGTGLSTTGNGILSITNSGSITALGSAANAVIQINNNSVQGATFTNSGTVTAKLLSSGLSVAISAYNGGVATNTGSITVNNNSGGTISGNVSLGTSPFNIATATFNNNSGGVWNVNGSNWFGGNANTINNFGTINIAAFSAFYPVLGSTFTFNNSGAVNVLANSAAYIGAAVSSIPGPGSFSIGDRSELEFGNSVAAGQTVSFVDGKGVLTLDQPSAFGGTIAGLSIGDTIDFLGGVVVSGASITGSTLSVAANVPNLNYTVSGAQSGTTVQCAVRRQDRDGSDFCAHLVTIRPADLDIGHDVSFLHTLRMMRSPNPNRR